MNNKLTLRYWDDPVLSVTCDPIDDSEFGSKLEEFGQSLIATMKDGNGIGLAAPQVGIAKRVFAMGFPESKCEPIVVCNPTLESGGPILYEREGCLSLPTIFEQVGRPQRVVLRYFKTNGKEDELELLNFDARVVFHEADHLLGIMFFDRRRVSRQVNRAVERAWSKIKHDYV